jgi:tRNA-splicing ligase RtcB
MSALRNSLHKTRPWEYVFVQPQQGVQVIPRMYINERIKDDLEEVVLEQIGQTSRIPRIKFLGYTPDVHFGKGTSIGTVMAHNLDNAMISSSVVGADIGCGISAQTTSLHVEDISSKCLEQLVQGLEEKLNPGNGIQADWAQDSFRRRAIQEFALGPDANSLARCFSLPPDELAYIEGMNEHKCVCRHRDFPSSRVWDRTFRTIGTLGGGNHFCEIQVARIAPAMKPLARHWGLFDGQIVVMLHTGSRGGGAEVGKMYSKKLKAEMHHWGITPPNADICYAPWVSEVGQEYYDAHRIALSIARANRMILRSGIADVFDSVFGKATASVKLLYDLNHNYVDVEYYGKERVLVHRKGATRAFPAGHHMCPEVYRDTGHPVFIPGSMGPLNRSYLFVGKPEGKRNYHTVAHGAGRSMSRSEAKRRYTNSDMQRALQYPESLLDTLPFKLPNDKVLTNAPLDGILDEIPLSYKDSTDVIDSIVEADLADAVASLYPLATIKGV